MTYPPLGQEALELLATVRAIEDQELLFPIKIKALVSLVDEVLRARKTVEPKPDLSDATLSLQNGLIQLDITDRDVRDRVFDWLEALISYHTDWAHD